MHLRASASRQFQAGWDRGSPARLASARSALHAIVEPARVGRAETPAPPIGLNLAPHRCFHAAVRLVGLGLVALLVVRGTLASEPALTSALGLVAMLGLAYANGANDVSKAVATLVSTGLATYRQAILWGTLWTGVGVVASAFAARGLVLAFKAGLPVDATPGPGAEAVLAMLAGALGWVLLATEAGLPVSTTHALAGAIAGVGVVSLGFGGVAWGGLVEKIALPLAVSPVLAGGLGLAAHFLIRGLDGRTGLSALHWLSSGGASLARGLNDAPKLVGLGAGFTLTGAETSVPLWAFFAVAAAMLIGGLAAGRRVAHTLAERVAQLDDSAGLGANLTTTLLVSGASALGWPVSTTHVSSAAIIGLGARRGRGAVRWRTVGELASAWLVTLPAAGLLAGLAFLALR